MQKKRLEFTPEVFVVVNWLLVFQQKRVIKIDLVNFHNLLCRHAF
jgi:hypothetical protein